MLEWREDMRRLMQNCGVDNRTHVFLFSDTQISNEGFVEDVNNILNNGEIPNLFADIEDYTKVLEEMREVCKTLPNYKDMQDLDFMDIFYEKCKTNLHVVLAMSPIGEAFRIRLRKFPSLVNCCTIDWFLPWPKEALQSVAEYLLHSVDLDNRAGIV